MLVIAPPDTSACAVPESLTLGALVSAVAVPDTFTLTPFSSRSDLASSVIFMPDIETLPLSVLTVTSCLAVTSTGPSETIWMAACDFWTRLTRCLPSLVLRLSCSPSGPSRNSTSIPVRDTSARRLTLPSVLSTWSPQSLSGSSWPLKTPPMTYGCCMLSWLNATSTSSPTSGSQTVPRLPPLPSWTTRAHQDS